MSKLTEIFQPDEDETIETRLDTKIETAGFVALVSAFVYVTLRQVKSGGLI